MAAKKETTKPIEGQSEEKDYEFRLLEANEIECRVGQGGNASQKKWCTLLLYKDARCDMKRLDEKFGIYGWKRKHELIGQNMFCTVSIYKDGIGWIEKQDVGTPSNTEAVKGQASDAFKRACFCLGIGRELYTAPKIFINLADGEYNKSDRLTTTFSVAYISYNEHRSIEKLIIVDNKNAIRYTYGMNKADIDAWLKSKVEEQGVSAPAPEETQKNGNGISDELYQQTQYAFPQIEQAQTWADLETIWIEFPELQSLSEFVDRIVFRRIAISKSKAELKNIWDALPQYHQNKNFVQRLTERKNQIAA
jgi:hypothetical protein